MPNRFMTFAKNVSENSFIKLKNLSNRFGTAGWHFAEWFGDGMQKIRIEYIDKIMLVVNGNWEDTEEWTLFLVCAIYTFMNVIFYDAHEHDAPKCS